MFDTNVFASTLYTCHMKLVTDQFLASVVVQELLVALSQDKQAALLKTVDELDKRKRLIVPGKDDWVQVGKCLYKLLHKNTNVGGHLTKEAVNLLVRDALIARCAVCAGAQLITSNTEDFVRIKSVFRGLRFTTPCDYFGMRPR